MIRKILFLIIILAITPIFISCGKKVYSKYNVYPIKSKIKTLANESNYIVLKAEIPKGSHIYANPKGPGTGKATTITLNKIDEIKFSSIKYEKGIKYTSSSEDDFVWVYKNETYFFIPFKIEKSDKTKFNLKVNFNSLLCSDSACMPRNYNFDIEITTVEKNDEVSSYNKIIQDKFNKIYNTNGATNSTIIKESKKSDNEFFKNENFKPQYLEESNISGIVQAILFGLLAGFILNFMPCVLPVVSLKVMSFVKHAGKDRKELFKLGLLFSLGILVSFAALATLAAFFGYNWGGLFQHKLFIIIMAAIIFALSLSMFEVFTINIPSFAGKAAHERTNHYSDAFMKGLLATLLATPCSGPFLGGTLAWALSQPPATIFVIFMSVGIGMALPYLLLTVNPKFMKYIPKPGNWMTAFENLMAFLLIFTVVYLISILDDNSVKPMVTFLAFIALAFWQYGKFGAIFQPLKKRIISTILLIVMIFGGYMISFNYLYKTAKVEVIESSKFSVERLYENRKSGKVSLIKFTADWCPNCKLVEKMALQTPKVQAAIEKGNVDFMIADITKSHPSAEKLLKLLGSRSIPFLALMPTGENFEKPICLRDIYSENDVLEILKKLNTNKNSTPNINKGMIKLNFN